MVKTGLEFAQGTTDDCKQLVSQVFEPGRLLGAYRAKRIELKTGDLVLVGSDYDIDIQGLTRHQYIDVTKRGIEKRTGRPCVHLPAIFRVLEHQSAHQIAKLPYAEDAFWLVVARGKESIPVLCALFAAPYEVAAPESPLVS